MQGDTGTPSRTDPRTWTVMMRLGPGAAGSYILLGEHGPVVVVVLHVDVNRGRGRQRWFPAVPCSD